MRKTTIFTLIIFIVSICICFSTVNAQNNKKQNTNNEKKTVVAPAVKPNPEHLKTCKDRIQVISMAIELWANDHNGKLPTKEEFISEEFFNYIVKTGSGTGQKTMYCCDEENTYQYFPLGNNYMIKCPNPWLHNASAYYFNKNEGNVTAKGTPVEEKKIKEIREENKKTIFNTTGIKKNAEERKKAEKLAKEKAEKDKIAKEKAEKDKIAKEKAEKDKIAKENAQKDKIAKEKAQKDKIAKEKAEKDKIAKEKAEKEKTQKPMTLKEKAKYEQAIRDKVVKGLGVKATDKKDTKVQKTPEQIAKDKAQKEQALRDKALKEKKVKEQEAKDKALKEKAEKERIAKEKAEKEKKKNPNELTAEEKEAIISVIKEFYDAYASKDLDKVMEMQKNSIEESALEYEKQGKGKAQDVRDAYRAATKEIMEHKQFKMLPINLSDITFRKKGKLCRVTSVVPIIATDRLEIVEDGKYFFVRLRIGEFVLQSDDENNWKIKTMYLY